MVLTTLTVILTGGIIVLAVINPYAALGLAPVLLAIAAIVRAVRGAKTTAARSDTSLPAHSRRRDADHVEDGEQRTSEST